MKRAWSAMLAAVILLIGWSAPSFAQAGDDFGVLVMAHGGGEQWNRSVEAMLAPVGEDHPLEIAFGMADAASIQQAVERLEARGANRIGVVRLFVSGESWRDRTAQILGLQPGAPPRPDPAHAGHGDHGGHGMALWRVDSDARFAMSQEGLAAAPEMDAVLVERVQALSEAPARESVLILAHGPGDDAENQRWIERIGARVGGVRALGFREVRVATLREDWPEKRASAQAEIRAFIEAANRDGGRAIVVPYRVQGFGPYAEALDGLTYVSDGRGLLPSEAVEQWVRRQVETLSAELAGAGAD